MKNVDFLLKIIENFRFKIFLPNFFVDVEISNYFVVECKKNVKIFVDSTIRYSKCPYKLLVYTSGWKT